MEMTLYYNHSAVKAAAPTKGHSLCHARPSLGTRDEPLGRDQHQFFKTEIVGGALFRIGPRQHFRHFCCHSNGNSPPELFALHEGLPATPTAPAFLSTS